MLLSPIYLLYYGRLAEWQQLRATRVGLCACTTKTANNTSINTINNVSSSYRFTVCIPTASIVIVLLPMYQSPLARTRIPSKRVSEGVNRSLCSGSFGSSSSPNRSFRKSLSRDRRRSLFFGSAWRTIAHLWNESINRRHITDVRACVGNLDRKSP